MADAVIIQSGITTVITEGGTAANVLPPNINGGMITNPVSNADQGITDAEPLYVNPIGAATLVGHGDVFVLQPGQTWIAVPGQSSFTSVNAVTSGHRFSAIWW